MPPCRQPGAGLRTVHGLQGGEGEGVHGSSIIGRATHATPCRSTLHTVHRTTGHSGVFSHPGKCMGM